LLEWVRESGIAVIDIRVLGPVVLVCGEAPVALGPQQQVLLLVLLLAAGRLVSPDRLADALWDRGARTRSPATLRSHVAHLRRALANRPVDLVPGDRALAPRLVTHRLDGGASYSLHVGPDQVDSARFGRLVADGRAALGHGRFGEASGLLAAARDLWRGQPLPEVADRPFAVGEVRRLQALHRAAWSGWAEAEVELGGHREVTGELEAMVGRWPDDEGLRRLLAVCLQRAGRGADAARVCRDGIVLALSQGLDPAGMEELQRDLLGPSPGVIAGRLLPVRGREQAG
jgi:DNA-binding SARP family transcriptional activator